MALCSGKTKPLTVTTVGTSNFTAERAFLCYGDLATLYCSVKRKAGRQSAWSAICVVLLRKFLSLLLYSPLDLGAFLSSLILYTVGRIPWTGDQPVARPLPPHITTQTQTSMPQVGFEPAIPVFERTKTVDALARAVGH
jgi:hypothetical protein